VLSLDRNTPVLDDKFRPLQKLQMFGEQCAALEILSGTGSPENVVSANKTRLYMNDATGALYIKRVNAIGSDDKQGWVLV